MIAVTGSTGALGGRVAATPMHGGPPPTIRDDSEAALRRLVAGDNHLTLAEYRDRLAEETGIRVHPWTLGRALRRLGLTHKKVAHRALPDPHRMKLELSSARYRQRGWLVFGAASP